MHSALSYIFPHSAVRYRKQLLSHYPSHYKLLIMKTDIIPCGFPVAEIELIYKTKVKASERVCIKSPGEAYQVFLQLWDTNKIDFVEEFKALFLNRAGMVLGALHVSSGCVDVTIADPRLVFVAALKLNAVGVIVCHNHPTKNLKPSMADKSATQKFKYAGEILEIRLLDHLIISNEGYYSFGDEGTL